MKVAVVGGGVIGLTCAHRLARAGVGVVVVERDLCGQAASLGNAGWITPILSTPLPAPGVLAKAVRWMLDPASPLLVRPRPDLSFAWWCLRFARNCTSDRFEQGTRALLALNERTLPLFDKLSLEGVEFEAHTAGLLIAALSDDVLEEEWTLLEQLRQFGYTGRLELLDSASARRLEPALGPAVAGAIYASDERHVRPETLTAALARSLRTTGAEIREGSPVVGIRRSGGGWSVETSSAEPVLVDRVVVAAGVWTRRLLQTLGTRLPLEAAKGYSITAAADGKQPRHAIRLQEARVGCSPFAKGLRLAGTLELAGESLTLNQRRLAAIVEAASRYLDYRPDPRAVEWAGLRPLLPDGLPVIGRVPTAEGVFVATGHGMLGVTLAPATAEALAPLVLEDREQPVLAPFRADRSY